MFAMGRTPETPVARLTGAESGVSAALERDVKRKRNVRKIFFIFRYPDRLEQFQDQRLL